MVDTSARIIGISFVICMIVMLLQYPGCLERIQLVNQNGGKTCARLSLWAKPDVIVYLKVRLYFCQSYGIRVSLFSQTICYIKRIFFISAVGLSISLFVMVNSKEKCIILHNAMSYLLATPIPAARDYFIIIIFWVRLNYRLPRPDKIIRIES